MDSLAQPAPMLSSNSSSSSSSRSTGGEWTGELYFYPDIDDVNKDVSEHVIMNAELNRFVEQNKETNKIEKMGKETRLEKLFPYPVTSPLSLGNAADKTSPDRIPTRNGR